jgi:phosphatidylserine/phosphatidylglycerophosphate/cardiolipin synthase-like enzyme
LPAPFKLRIYADHLSPMFLGGRARPKARALLGPWLDLYRRLGIDPRTVQIEIYVHAHGAFLYDRGARYSVHDKLLIVDGAYLHIGGANPQVKNNYNHPERDSAVVVKGEVASSALAAFDSLWSKTDFACTIEKRGDSYRPVCRNRSTPFTVEHVAAVTTPDLERAGVPANACLPMTVMSKGRVGFRNVGGYSNPWAKGLLAAVSAAGRDIALSSPNMNTPQLQGALVEALGQRNVRVRLLLPFARNEPQVGAFGGYGSNERSMSVLRACALVAKGRSADEYEGLTTGFQGGWWVADGERERFRGDGPGCFHTKFASFDDQAVILGSGNLDDQSFYHSSETSVLVDSPVVTKAVRQFLFESDWTRSKRFDLTMPLLGPTSPRDTALDRIMADAASLCSGLAYSLR